MIVSNIHEKHIGIKNPFDKIDFNDVQGAIGEFLGFWVINTEICFEFSLFVYPIVFVVITVIIKIKKIYEWIILVYNTHNNVIIYTLSEADMRTNIELDDDLIERAQQLTGIKTKREVVHEALRLLILLNEQKEIRTLRGKLPWVGNLSEQRQSRVEVH